MDFVSHRGITLILFGRSVIQPICLFDVHLFVTFHSSYLSFDGLNSPLLKKCFSDLNFYEEVKTPGLVLQLKLTCLLMIPTHDDIIEAKEVSMQSTAFWKIQREGSVV